MKKVIYIVFFTLLTIVLGLLGYFIYQYFQDNELVIPTPSREVVEITNEDNRLVNKVRDEEMIAYWLDASGRLVFIQPSGQIANLSTQVVSDINNVEVASDESKLLVQLSYPKNNTFTVFNINSRSWSTLPSGTIAAAWHPTDSNQIVYLQNNGLRTINLDNEKSSLLARISLVDVDLDWAGENEILIKDKPSVFAENKVWLYNTQTKIIQKVDTASGLIIKQEGTLRVIFKGARDNTQNQMHLINDGLVVDTRFLFSRSSPVTIPDKCLLQGEDIYCAVPRVIPSEIVMPDDYLKRRFLSEDDVYHVRINENKIETRFIPLRGALIDAIKLRKIENNLYFINRRDNKLYSIKVE